MSKKLTIKEIAKEAGVSVSTVSRVLNNHPSIRPEKRRLVQEIIDRENFQPSMLARGMISNQTKNIAVLLPDISNPYFTDLINQIDQSFRKLGYSLLLLNTATAGHSKSEHPVSQEKASFATIIEKNVDGVLILGGEIDKVTPKKEYLTALNKMNQRVPVVIVGQPNPEAQVTFLPRDLRQGTQMALQHLLALGYEEIGFIGGEPGVTITEERVKAFKENLTLYREVHEEWIQLSDFYSESGYQSMSALLAGEHHPRAVVAINDKVALGGIRALNDVGLSCPEDMAIVSCDAFPDGEYYSPRLTSINQNNQLLGAEAATLLINRIDGKPATPQKIYQPELIIRESCGVQLRRKQ